MSRKGPSLDTPAPSRGSAATPGPIPRAPRSLCPEAQALWRRLAPELHRRGLLTPLNHEILAVYCDVVVVAERARVMVQEGLLSRGRLKGQFVTNPVWRIYRDSLGLMRSYAADLGIIPARPGRGSLPS